MQNRIRDRFDIKEILKFLVGGGSAVITDAVVYETTHGFFSSESGLLCNGSRRGICDQQTMDISKQEVPAV